MCRNRMVNVASFLVSRISSVVSGIKSARGRGLSPSVTIPPPPAVGKNSEFGAFGKNLFLNMDLFMAAVFNSNGLVVPVLVRKEQEMCGGWWKFINYWLKLLWNYCFASVINIGTPPSFLLSLPLCSVTFSSNVFCSSHPHFFLKKK